MWPTLEPSRKLANSKLPKLWRKFLNLLKTPGLSTNQVCQVKNTIQARQIKSGDTVSIDLGCYIRTMDHVISADESETVEIQKKTMDRT
jgi:hypothetical protein